MHVHINIIRVLEGLLLLEISTNMNGALGIFVLFNKKCYYLIEQILMFYFVMSIQLSELFKVIRNISEISF